MRPATLVLFQIVGHMLGEQNVTGITAIHYPLRDVDSGSGDIRLLIEITDFIDRAAVNPHAHPQFGMTFEFPANFDRTEDRRFGAGAENERAAVSSGQAEEFAFRFSQAELLRPAYDLFQCLKLLALLSDEHFRVTDNVDEQNVPDLQLDLFLNFGGHVTAGILRISR